MALFLYTLLVVFLAVIPDSGLHKFRMPFPHADKAVHFFEFALLYALACRACMRHRIRLWNTRATRWGLVYAFFFGITTEFAQVSVPGRQFDWLDMAMNLSGALVYAMIYRVRYHHRT